MVFRSNRKFACSQTTEPRHAHLTFHCSTHQQSSHLSLMSNVFSLADVVRSAHFNGLVGFLFYPCCTPRAVQAKSQNTCQTHVDPTLNKCFYQLFCLCFKRPEHDQFWLPFASMASKMLRRKSRKCCLAL